MLWVQNEHKKLFYLSTLLRFSIVIAAHAAFHREMQESVVVICLKANKRLEMAQVTYV